MAPLWHINYKTHHLFIQTVYYIYLQIGIKAFSTFYASYYVTERQAQEKNAAIYSKVFRDVFHIEFFFCSVILCSFLRNNVEM
jgi:hypothetical protein